MKRIVTVALVCALVLTAGTTGALAQGNGGERGDDVVRVGSGDVAIDDANIRITDVHLTGTGLPDRSIDHATYTVRDSTVMLDGATVTVGDTRYRVGEITVTIRDVGVTVEDVSIGS